MQTVNRLLSLAVAAVLFGSLLVTIPSVQASSAISTQSSPTFVWFYGYVGGEYYPTTQLGLTQAQVLHEASVLSDKVGQSNLRLVTAVDTTQSQIANASMLPTIKTYVDKLETYASVVYGRVDLQVFNLTSPITVYQMVDRYVDKMDLNGIWFDHAVIYYRAVGRDKFNSMMQNLADEFPTLNFILNNAADQYGVIAPFQKDTWQANTYISPTVKQGNYDYVNLRLVSRMYKLYPNRVLLHFDASLFVSGEPMGVFADQTTKNEVDAVTFLAAQGDHPANQTEAYSLLYPILGSWTYFGSKYDGTLYNSLSTGEYNRDTAKSFIAIMTEY